MANIPVERTGGGWWKWLLALLLLLGLIWLIAELFDDGDEVELAEADPVVDTVDFDCPAVGADFVTTLDQIMDARGADLVGCQVDLNNMRVVSLTGDSSFFMADGPDPDRGILVVLQGMNESESLPAPPTGRDGMYNVDVGDVISVDGEVASFGATVPDYAEMPDEDRNRILRRGLYVNANDVNM